MLNLSRNQETLQGWDRWQWTCLQWHCGQCSLLILAECLITSALVSKPQVLIFCFPKYIICHLSLWFCFFKLVWDCPDREVNPCLSWNSADSLLQVIIPWKLWISRKVSYKYHSFSYGYIKTSNYVISSDTLCSCLLCYSAVTALSAFKKEKKFCFFLQSRELLLLCFPLSVHPRHSIKLQHWDQGSGDWLLLPAVTFVLSKTCQLLHPTPEFTHPSNECDFKK